MRDLTIRSRYSGPNSDPAGSAARALALPLNPNSMRSRASAILCLCGLGIAASAIIFAFLGTGLSLLIDSREAAGPERSPAMTASDASRTSIRGFSESPAVTPIQDKSPKPPAQTEARATMTGETPATSATPRQITSSISQPANSGADSGSTVSQTSTLPPDRQAIDTGKTPATADSHTAPSLPKDRSAAAASTVVAPLAAPEINTLLLQGDAAFRRGDLASARLLYRRAFEAGEGRGALGIGASYDPFFLRRFHLWTQISDPDEARVWYLRAGELGTSEAKLRLDRLGTRPSR